MAKTEQYDEQHRKHLGRLLETRRGELGYPTRPSMEQATGLNVRLVADVEKGYRGNFKDDTLGRIARAYQVTSASITAILRGDADKLEPAPPAAPAAPLSVLPPITDETRAAAARPWYDAIRDAIDAWLEANPGKRAADVPGPALFPDSPADARTWDDPNLRRTFTVSQMAWLLADIRRADAGRAAGRNGSGLAGA